MFDDNKVLMGEETRINNQISINKTYYKKIIDNSNAMEQIPQENINKYFKILNIEGPVIKYFVLYSWLNELCNTSTKDCQKITNNYILSTTAYKNSKYFNHPIPIRQGRTFDDGTYLCYLRNLIVHSVASALNEVNSSVLNEIKSCTTLIMRIILEKLRDSF